VIRLAALLVLLSIPLALGAADLAAVQAEPNLVKRARGALDNAAAAYKAAEEAYIKKGDPEQANAALDEVSQSVELAYASLRQTGKNPVKSPGQFKAAEIRTRELLRRLGDLRQAMSALDRDHIDTVRAAIQKVHDDLLAGIMGGKKK
jgi:tetratricopeptide (TPR) repeat protein